VSGCLGFAMDEQARRAAPPNRVRYPAGYPFASSCSPPRIAAAQSLSTSQAVTACGGDFHPADKASSRTHPPRQSRAEPGGFPSGLIVNATPIAESHGGPIMIEKLRDARYLLDVVFTPKETKLAAFARQQGLAVGPGWRMLLHQALYQFELYTGKNAPHQTMASVLEKALS